MTSYQEDFTGRVVLVVGAARGIGADIAVLLAESGAIVAQADVIPADRWASGLAAPHSRHVVDVRDPGSCRDLIAASLTAHGSIDHLVNSAAIIRRAPASAMTDQDFTDVLDVNVSGTFRVCQAAYPALRSSHGTVVLLSSTNGLVAVRDKAGYATSKASVIHLTRVLALEWASEGIRVNSVAPTLTETPINAEQRADPVQLAAWLANIPLGRMAQPRDVAHAVAFLLSPSAAMITGQTLFVDGGATL